MNTIVVACEKGGVGKTLISQELFYYYQREGVPVSLYSLDPQYTNRTQKTEGAQIAIVDTPGSRHPAVLEVIRGADLVIVPTRPNSGLDLQPFLRTIQAVRQAERPFLIVINCWNRYRVSSLFTEWLQKKEWAKHVCILPVAEAFAQAAMEEKSVLQIAPKSKAANAISALCVEVNTILNM